MTTNDMQPPEISAEIAREISEFMYYLHETFRGHPREVVSTLSSSLATYISVVAKDPERALASCALLLKNFNWEEAKQQYFGFTLGAHETQRPKLSVIPVTGSLPPDRGE